MKVSINWIKQFTDIDLKSDELVQKIGAQLGSVEDVTDLSEIYQDVVIAEVISCQKHPNADKLSICSLDDGGRVNSVQRDESGYVQVVCGAPNVRVGLRVAWLPPGSIVPSSRGSQEFTLESRELRGVLSHGMIASLSELAISDEHDGIAELELDIVPGTSFAEHYGLDDVIIDLENKMFTHRPDCFGILGVSREIAGIYHQPFTSPDWYQTEPVFSDSFGNVSIDVDNKAPDKVPRFMVVAMDTVSVGPSPVWLQSTLAKVGIKPINNVVDVTNYIMHMSGQPLHAFDYDKMLKLSNQPSIYPRLSEKGERLTLLGNKEVELTGEEIVISTDKHPIALAGVMGGLDTEVDESTTRIVIECATFDMYSIRRTSMRLGIFTDAVTRFNKGQSPLQNAPIIQETIEMMTKLTGARQSSKIYDQKGDELASGVRSISVSIKYLNDRLSTDFTGQEIMELLSNVEIKAIQSEGGLKITPPFWRRDLHNPEDILEEVGRLYGFDRLPVRLPSRPNRPSPKNQLFEYKYQLRDRLSSLGANEVLTYSFVHGELLRKVGINPEEDAFHIRNAISPDLQYYRPSLLPSLLTKIHPNIKAQAGTTSNQFALFELGASHQKNKLGEDGLPQGRHKLAFILAADERAVKSHRLDVAYYQAKQYLEQISSTKLDYRQLTNPRTLEQMPFAEGRSAIITVGDIEVGTIGEFNPSLARSLKLPAYCAGFELDVVKLFNLKSGSGYEPIPQHPSVKQDLTLDVAIDSQYSQVFKALSTNLTNLTEAKGYTYKIEPVSIFVPEDRQSKKFSFRIELWHPRKTLTSQEASAIVSSSEKL